MVKLTKDEMDKMIGIIGDNYNRPPALSICGQATVYQKGLGQTRMIAPDKYVGINFGENWNEENYQQIVEYVRGQKRTSIPKVSKDEQNG